MDKKLKFAHILSGIASIGCICFCVSNIYLIVALIPIALLYLSIKGSLRARLALIGFLLFFANVLYMKLAYSGDRFFESILIGLLRPPSGIFSNFFLTASFVNFLVMIAAFILLFRSIDIEETSSKFSEKTPLLPAAVLFLLLAGQIIAYFFFLPLSNLGEYIRRISEVGFRLIPIIVGLAFMAVYIFTAVSLLIKRAVGYILAPALLVMIVLTRMNSLIQDHSRIEILVHLRRLIIYGFSGKFVVVTRWAGYIILLDYSILLIVLLFGTPLAIIFILCLREDTIGIVRKRLKD